jgi:hypothetical protein
LLSLRIGLEFVKELLAGGYLAGWCSLSADALGERELYRLRTLRAVDPHGEKPEQEDHRQQQNTPDS